MGLFSELGEPEKLDSEVRFQLAHSLEHIVSRAGDYLDVDANDSENAASNIRKHKQDPGVFARYYDLIFAINSNQFTLASQLMAEIISLSNQTMKFAVLPYLKENLNSDYERFPRLLFSEYEEINPMASPSEVEFSNYLQMMHKAIEIVRQVDKSIYDEIMGLLVRIYIATDSNNKSARKFSGVTSFMVWGATFVNIYDYKTQWQLVQFLVHELTHGMLYGLNCDPPLVMNSPSENYNSPLRVDERPMDGIYHATLVSARLVAFNRRWLDSGLVLEDEQEIIEQTTDLSLSSFQDGKETIKKHGKLSELAQQLLERSCAELSVSF